MWSPLDIDNQSLIEECKRGDRSALNLFYLRFSRRMMGVVRRYVSDEKDAEDILHDGFIVAYTRLGTLRDPDKVEYWLASIMKNLSIQFLQSQDVLGVLHDIPEVEDTPNPEDMLDFATLEMLIKKLPPGYQKVFRLAVLEHKSHKEIAKLLGIEPNSSSSQLFHAKMMMRKLVTEYKKQAGMLALLLLFGSAGVMLWHGVTKIDPLPQINIAKVYDDSDNTLPKFTEENIASIEHIPPTADQSTTKETDGGSPEEHQVTTNDDDEQLREEELSSQKEAIEDMETNQDEQTIPYRTPSFHKKPAKKKGSGSSWNLSVNATVTVASGDLSLSSNEAYGSADIGLSNGVKPGDDPFFGEPGTDNDKDKDKDKDKNTRNFAAPTRDYSESSFSDYQRMPHRNSMPLAFSVALSKSLNKTFEVETGLTYTYLHTSFQKSIGQFNCHWHYLGIPLKLNINTYSFKQVKMYAGVGGIVNFPLHSSASLDKGYQIPGLTGEFKSPVVWAISASFGISYKLSENVAIYVEPTIQYNIPHYAIVPNTWSDNNFNITLPIGFRFSY